MFKVPDVAKRLNCSNSTVYGLVDSGKLVCHRIGRGRGTVRVSEEDLTTYLDSCRTEKVSVVRTAPTKLASKQEWF